MKRPPLPIDEILSQLVDAVAAENPVVLKAPPGAGKTTGVPLALANAINCDKGQIWVVQPRRLAARSVADYLATSLNEPIGETIGYHVRLDRKESSSTHVLLMTTGIFLQRMRSDPLLEKAACVILDEFHERSLELDLSLALTHRLRTQLRNDLRMIVMSATLDPHPIADYLGDTSRSLECHGRSFPVKIHHHQVDPRARLERSITPLICDAAQQTDGHVLVFLPGVADIHRVGETLRHTGLAEERSIVPLHGALTPKQQDDAVRNDPSAPRKIILSTNIAETSVTVDRVTAVVDSGLSKTPVLDTRLGLTRLQTGPISIASADQRAGRAGRTSAGTCDRMWSTAAHRTRDLYDSPEVSRSDLSSAFLTLASLGEDLEGDFPWFTPPPEHAARAAIGLLNALGAIGDANRITSVGRVMSTLPLHPRVSRFAITASELLGTELAAAGAALMSERDPVDNQDSRWSELSLAEKMQHVVAHPKSMGRNFLHITRQIQRSLEGSLTLETSRGGSSDTKSTSHHDAVAQSLLAAYPDRVVMRRDGDEDRGVMVGRRGVLGLKRIADLSQDSRLLLCYDVDGNATESRVRGAVSIDESWLPNGSIQNAVSVDFDAKRETVVCRAVEKYADLVLSETPITCEENPQTSERLYSEAIRQLEKVYPQDARGKSGDFENVLQRIRLVIEHCLDEHPPFGDVDELCRDVCRELCHGRRSFAELRRAAWTDYLIGKVGYEFWEIVQSVAPTHLTLPSGNRARVGYAENRPPWIEARIQECFGWPQTPRILRGNVAVQMHLLGPNRRPQQITEDLESFWKNTYGEIRKELRRRYPKHHWPEDPTTAKATHNGLKPREK